MKVYTLRKVKDTHSIFTVNPKIFNELLNLNPNLYFCIHKLMHKVSELTHKKLVINYDQQMILQDKANEQLRTADQALHHILDSNSSNIIRNCYHMFMEAVNLDILLEIKQLSLKDVQYFVKKVNTMYDQICQLSFDYNTKQEYIKSKKVSGKLYFSLTQKAKDVLNEQTSIALYTFLTFPKKFYCYATIEWDQDSISYFTDKLEYFDIAQLNTEQQWEYAMFNKTARAFTPLEQDDEFICWILLFKIILI